LREEESTDDGQSERDAVIRARTEAERDSGIVPMSAASSSS